MSLDAMNSYYLPDLDEDSNEVAQPTPIPYEDEADMIHYVDDTGAVLHNPNYADDTCPCHAADETEVAA